MQKRLIKLTSGLKMSDNCNTKSQNLNQIANCVYRFKNFRGKMAWTPSTSKYEYEYDFYNTELSRALGLHAGFRQRG